MQGIQTLQEIVQQLNIIDDTLFQKMAEDPEFCEETNTYDFEKFPKVSNRKKQFKASEGGNKDVCELVENYARGCAEVKGV